MELEQALENKNNIPQSFHASKQQRCIHTYVSNILKQLKRYLRHKVQQKSRRTPMRKRKLSELNERRTP